MVIVGFPGAGKTNFFKENEDKAYDLDTGFFRYKGAREFVFGSIDEDVSKIDIGEVSKRIKQAYEVFRDKSNQEQDFWEVLPNWENFYSRVIEKFENEGDKPYILVPIFPKEVENYLNEKEIEMIYVIPSIESKNDFMNRYANRNDGRQQEMFSDEEKFMKQIIWLDKIIPDDKKILLGEGEYLSDAIQKIEVEKYGFDK